MEHQVYTSPEWRSLPREACAVALLFPGVCGPCSPTIHRHHVDPGDPESESYEVCSRHHPKVQAILRRLLTVDPDDPPRRRCTHHHPYPQGREECERRLNAVA